MPDSPRCDRRALACERRWKTAAGGGSGILGPMRWKIRSALERLLSREVIPLPPRPADPSVMARARAGLAWFLSVAPGRFTRFFLHERILRASRREAALFRLLEPLGLVEHLASILWKPSVRLVPLAGRFFAADLNSYEESDQVFSPMFEQVYFVRNMVVRPGDEVLEIGVGSGVLSILAGDTAGAVTGVEISERALEFARFNRDLNAAKGALEFRPGSLFQPIEAGRRFDLVITNPPFEPTPPGQSRFRHSDAGTDGLDIMRGVLAGVTPHLKPEGRLDIFSWSPGSSRRALLVDLVRDALPEHRIAAHFLDTWPIDEHLARFASSPGHDLWRTALAESRLTHMHCLFLHAERASNSGVEVLHPREEIATCHAIADAWIS